MIRLVKGAYWDSEIKARPGRSLDGFPVFTRKIYTDVSYLACARKLLAGAGAVYPQFATHNAQTARFVLVSLVRFLPRPVRIPVPARHGRTALRGGGQAATSSIRRAGFYAPGRLARDLLAYLVRRLLENGANTSS